jgi:hypothetical protein
MFGVNDNNDQSMAANPANHVPAVPAHNPISGHTDHTAEEAHLSTPPSPPARPADASGGDDSDLLELKQKALNSLAPMVNKLDQSPEEKFKTLMMLIQASDNSGLVKEAYAVAEQITDEKERAQALIDIVNEINYFTQSKTA